LNKIHYRHFIIVYLYAAKAAQKHIPWKGKVTH